MSVGIKMENYVILRFLKKVLVPALGTYILIQGNVLGEKGSRKKAGCYLLRDGPGL